MSERIDVLARRLAHRGPRRSTLLGLGALGLGSLIAPGAGHEAETKKNNNNNNNQCKQCKKKCKRNNRKKGKKDPNNCGNKCRNKCRNKNK